ncbi:Hypothetical predicted protein [Mytilus galloprovincialis]|uniref:Peptidase C1A papain C-terminal domain-containing protein n=1 Tax=Mytilus galloprovincialis TaxID=29158 RepID=A0A8B6E1K2_MYTGA|nr:Hypothetical predicted protein [Mytilus galloprovincialis]
MGKHFGIKSEREKTVDNEMARDTTLEVEMEREKIFHMGMQWGMISEIDMLREINLETGMQCGKYFDKELERENTIYMEKQWGKNVDMDKQWKKILDIGMKRRQKYHEYPLVERKYNEMFVHDHVKCEPYSRSHRRHKYMVSETSYDDVLEEFYTLVEKNGAQTTRIWAPKYEIQSVVCYSLAVYILDKLKTDEEFLNVFIQKCLPPACRDMGGEIIIGTLVNSFQMFNCRIASRLLVNIDKVVKNISMVFEKAKVQYKEVVQSRHFTEYFDETMMKNVGSVFSVMTVSDIVHDCRNEHMSAERKTDEIMKVISPFIYGRTPLFEALNITLPIFLKDEFSEHTKVLFILSDGIPTDSGDLHMVSERLKNLNVIVVGCFISGYSNIELRKLYSVEKEEWDEGAKFLFKLSSTIPSQLLPRTIFIKRGWDIDISNNETKLFLQINHPDHIHEACSLARNVVCCQDSLSDLLVSVSLDTYINQSTYGFKAQLQVGGTCYANASAVVLDLSMKRILGRDGGYPDFKDLREKIIELHGKDGANTLNVLEGIVPEYRLHCNLVDAKDAMKAIAAKRPVVATFCLTDPEWNQFSSMFYQRNPTSILTKAEIDLSKRDPRPKLTGHAVVLTSFNSECLRFMNSWGDNWADMGFFRVQNSIVLDFKFIDVFWTLNDLSERETEYFKKHGAEVADKIMKNLIGLQEAKYKCPECSEISLVTEFSGSLSEAVCPKCYETFHSDDAGNSLALNMYLTSLSK